MEGQAPEAPTAVSVSPGLLRDLERERKRFIKVQMERESEMFSSGFPLFLFIFYYLKGWVLDLGSAGEKPFSTFSLFLFW